MERGLMWLPLLGLFIGLAYAGWNEYQKLQGYRYWSQQFEKCKYDIYAVLGYKDREISWGKPSRKGIINLEKFSLNDVDKINLLVNGEEYNKDIQLKKVKNIQLLFELKNQNNSIKIPFIDMEQAVNWYDFLKIVNS